MALRSILTAIGTLAALSGAAAPVSAAPETMVYTGAACNGREKLPRFESVIGRPVEGYVEFLSYGTWPEFSSSLGYSLSCWRDTPYRLVLSIPMLAVGGDMKKAAQGEYDQYYQGVADQLVKAGQSKAYLRIGWEFNGNWYIWKASKDPEAWIATFRRIAKIFKSTPGSDFQIVWNPNHGRQAIAPDKVWPGDDVVDVIGTDLYNRSYSASDTTPALRWKRQLTEPNGLNWLVKFATAHNKPIALPEWGTGTAKDGSGQPDDPDFIRNVAAWIAANNVVFQAYWDYPAPDYRGLISTGAQPNALAAFKEVFGTPPSAAGQ
ncbi:glycoside hydrolase family 26 protein [Sphingomonas montanisoli]|uniref:Glycosidase n=1 Tax=Sphingomonas montanisoli TaxID=2606412 RepID=A0A5D9C4C2_9SPHN|nr:glycosyl hydrolase [Sphingomonas montanisoli]TZG25850.1 glycosidase [Sphingomonas montanisoli]